MQKNMYSMISFLLIFKNHQSVMYVLWNHLYKSTQADVGMIYFGGGNGRRDWVEFSFIGDDLFLKKTDLKQIWQTVVGVLVTNFSAYYVCRTSECFSK